MGDLVLVEPNFGAGGRPGHDSTMRHDVSDGGQDFRDPFLDQAHGLSSAAFAEIFAPFRTSGVRPARLRRQSAIFRSCFIHAH